MAGIVILWIILSVLFASLSRNRKIGFGSAFLICILLSPLIGLIVVLISEKHSESLMKLKIAYDSGSMPKEEYDKKVRKIIPNKEDKKNMLLGYAVVGAIGLIIYLINRFFG
jgi:hypothetical protein